MRSSNFGYVFLLGVVFAAPACKVEANITDGEAGSGGSDAGTGGNAGMSGSAGKNASAGQGGTGGSSGAAETGGASGASGASDTGGAAGSSEGGGAGEPSAEAGTGGVSSTCDTSGFEFPEVTCDTGAVSELTNPTCQDVFLCVGLADCRTSHMDCAMCLDYLKVAFESTDTCVQSGTQTTLANACTKLAEDNANQYPQCVPK